MNQQIAYLSQLKQTMELYQFMVKLCWLKTLLDAQVKEKSASGAKKIEAEPCQEKSTCKSLPRQEKSKVSTIAASEVIKGRMYDFNNGRFFSVDPFIQGTTSQAINPYSYIQNNPLSGTDPTGYKIVAESYECGTGEGQFDCGALLSGALPSSAMNSGKNSDSSKVQSVTTDISNIDVPEDCDAFTCTVLREAKDAGGDISLIIMPDGRTMLDFRRKDKLSTHLGEDLKSGRAADRVGQAIKAEISIVAGGLEIVLGFNPMSGAAGGLFVGMHGVGNVSGGIGDYMNIFDGGSRDANIVKTGYENLAVLAGGSKESGELTFYAVDFAMGVGALATPIKVPVDSGSFGLNVPQIAGGHASVSTLRASGASTASRDAFILIDTARSTSDSVNQRDKENQ